MKAEILQQKGYNFLWFDDELWMYDIPGGLQVQQCIADQAFGDVLVAGYGLGVLQRMLIENSAVGQVVTVEKNIEVVDLCKARFGELYGQVIIEDFYEFIPSVAKVNHIDEYDCVIGDIWLEIHPMYLEQYKKFVMKAELLKKIDGKILAWGQEYYESLL